MEMENLFRKAVPTGNFAVASWRKNSVAMVTLELHFKRLFRKVKPRGVEGEEDGLPQRQ